MVGSATWYGTKMFYYGQGVSDATVVIETMNDEERKQIHDNAIINALEQFKYLCDENIPFFLNDPSRPFICFDESSLRKQNNATPNLYPGDIFTSIN
jgi:hypothetical protein